MILQSDGFIFLLSMYLYIYRRHLYNHHEFEKYACFPTFNFPYKMIYFNKSFEDSKKYTLINILYIIYRNHNFGKYMEPWREDTRFVWSITIKPLQKWYTGVPWPIYHDIYGLYTYLYHIYFSFQRLL